MQIQFKTGSIFSSEADMLINPVNTVGVMGAGLAEQFKKKFPKNFEAYRQYCHTINSFKEYRYFVTEEKGKIIFNFATKEHYSFYSTLSYIRRSLIMLVNYIELNKITSIALPPIGCGLGGLDEKNVLHLIIYFLRQVPHQLKVELYQFKGIKPLLKNHILKHYDFGYREYDSFTGVGSRRLDHDGELACIDIGRYLTDAGYILYTGDAPKGCDVVFWDSAHPRRRVRFGPPTRKRPNPDTIYVQPGTTSYRLAEHIAGHTHPAWRWLKPEHRELHIRNAFQVLGSNLATPTEFLICWTPDAVERKDKTSKKTGGTGTAIRIADSFGIPVFNLASPTAIDRLENYLGVKIPMVERVPSVVGIADESFSF